MNIEFIKNFSDSPFIQFIIWLCITMIPIIIKIKKINNNHQKKWEKNNNDLFKE